MTSDFRSVFACKIASWRLSAWNTSYAMVVSDSSFMKICFLEDMLDLRVLVMLAICWVWVPGLASESGDEGAELEVVVDDVLEAGVDGELGLAFDRGGGADLGDSADGSEHTCRLRGVRWEMERDLASSVRRGT